MNKLFDMYISDMYFTIPNKLSNIEYNLFEDIYPEIALSWNVKLIDSWRLTPDSTRIYCFQARSAITDDIVSFFEKNAELIISNKIPVLNFSNKWCQILNRQRKDVPDREVTNTKENKVNEKIHLKFFYLIVKSYLKLVETNHILFNYLDTVILQPDFTISASFSNINQYHKFQDILDSEFNTNNSDQNILNTLLLIEDTDDINFYDRLDKLDIETTVSLTNALSVRWYWMNMPNYDNLTLLIKLKNHYHIVIDTESPAKLLTDYDPDYINKIRQEVNSVKDNTGQINNENIVETSSELQFENEFSNVYLEEIDTDVYKRLEKYNYELADYRKDFVKHLRQHYINCRHDQDVITKEQISKMSILDLLEIIIVQDGDEQHCFSRDFLMKTGLYVDPATGYTLNERIVRIMKQQDFGIRGYFDYGILQGIGYVPELPTLNIEKATVDINIIDDYLTIDLLVPSKNLVSRDYFEMNMVGEFTLSLADINLNLNSNKENKSSSKDSKDIFTQEQIVQFADDFTEMWIKGQLLSDWGYHMLIQYGKISRRSFKEYSAAISARENDVYGRRFITKIREMFYNQ